MQLPRVEGAVVCVTAPPEKADRSPACELIARGTGFGGFGGERLIGAAAVHYPEHDLGVIAMVTDRKGMGEISEESITLIRNDVANSFQRRGLGFISPPGPDPLRTEKVEIRGARGLRFTIDVIGAADAPVRFVAYFLYQQDRAHTLLFVGPTAHATELDAYATSALATLQVPAGELRMFGKPRWQRNAQWYGVRLAPFFVASVLVIPALYVWDRRRRANAQAN